MKIDLAYRKIPDSRNCPLKQCVAFEKYDGTNLHWVWNGSWLSFGTRRDRYDLTDEGIQAFHLAHFGLEECTNIFQTVWAEKLDLWFRSKIDPNQPIPVIIAYTEYLGKNSFAGSHIPSDPKFLVLFDIAINKIDPESNSDTQYLDKGMLAPEEFLEFTKGLDPALRIAKVIFKGKYSSELGEKVRNGKYGVFEGVVVKGVVKGELYMIKIKTNTYMNKLKESFKEKWTDFWE
jgi:hypothetical protein